MLQKHSQGFGVTSGAGHTPSPSGYTACNSAHSWSYEGTTARLAGKFSSSLYSIGAAGH